MAGTSSVKCLSGRRPCQTLQSLNSLPSLKIAFLSGLANVNTENECPTCDYLLGALVLMKKKHKHTSTRLSSSVPCSFGKNKKANGNYPKQQGISTPYKPQNLVSPVSRKPPWINFGFKKVKLGRNADNSGREFWAWIFWVAWNPGKTRLKISLSKFAIKIRWEIRRQFS